MAKNLSGKDLNNVGYKVSMTQCTWAELVINAWGSEWNERDICYEFSNGEVRREDNRGNTGVYNGGASS